ncbi:MAG: alpha/beta hydrolase, partial [Cyclobacteriaceae bacterium]
AITYGIRADKPTQFEIKRGQDSFKKEVQLNPLPKEKHENIDTFYETVTSDYGIKQRAIITKPKGKKKLPAIILIQGLSCSTVEEYSGRSNNWVKLIKDLAEKSNMVFMRIEKPGVGDSEGDCGKTDFLTELNGYESAVEVLKSKPYVDASKIIVYGNSMGSALAPYLANKFNLAGVISDGTFYKSWYEHMLEIERRILQIEEKNEEEIYDLMNEVYIPLYYEMLIKKRSFENILEDNPTCKKYHRQGLNHMYGRPMEYYHQVQDFNFAKNWEEVKVPVRVRWGTNDWIMTENDNDMIMEVLDESGHKDHKLYKYEKLDHWSTIHPDYSSSFNFKPGKWEDKISQQIINWAWEIVKE